MKKYEDMERDLAKDIDATEDLTSILKLPGYPDAKDFKPYDPKKSVEDFHTVIVFGSRGTGKTHLLLNFLNEIKDKYTSVHVFSKSCRVQRIPGKSELLWGFVPEKNRHNTFDIAALEEIHRMQEEYAINQETSPDSFPLIIMDDIIGDPRTRSCELLNDIFTLGRHYKYGGIFFLSQLCSGRDGINKCLRDNADIVICFKVAQEYNRELIASQWLSTISLKLGRYVLKTLTNEKYQAIVISVRDKNEQDLPSATRIQDYVCTYKAPKTLPSFKIGKPDAFVWNGSRAVTFPQHKKDLYIRVPGARIL